MRQVKRICGPHRAFNAIAAKDKESEREIVIDFIENELPQGTPRTASLQAAEEEGPRFGAHSSRHFVDSGERAHLLIEPDDLVHFVVVLQELAQLRGTQRPVSVRAAAGRGHFFCQSVPVETRDGSVRGGIQSARRWRAVYIGMRRDRICSACKQSQLPTVTVDRHTS